MKTISKSAGPKQRLLETALNLFYTQGYLATGINQVIEEAGVSKASFYDHFKSKEELCVAYLQERHNRWSGWFKDKINEQKMPYDRFMAPIAFLDSWMEKCNFRGCAFLNIASEVTDIKSNIRKEVIYHKDGLKAIVREITKDLKNSDKRYKGLDVEFITDAYYVLIEGAISASQNYGEKWPIDAARKSIEKLVGKE